MGCATTVKFLLIVILFLIKFKDRFDQSAANLLMFVSLCKNRLYTKSTISSQIVMLLGASERIISKIDVLLLLKRKTETCAKMILTKPNAFGK